MIPKGVLKSNLPTKNCPVCKRSFTWRKKWARNWNEVIYCSDACRTKKRTIKSKPNEN